MHILVGYRDHVSGCCDNNTNAAREMIGESWCPKPDIKGIIGDAAVSKVKMPESDDPASVFIAASLHNFERCRGHNCEEDTVALRMWSYLQEDDVARDLLCSSQIDAHREDRRKVAIDKSANKGRRD